MKLIPLTKGCFAKVDDDDFDWMSNFRWVLLNSKRSPQCKYAVRWGSKEDGDRGWIFMHHEVAKAKTGKKVDHIDRDGLNNQSSNLRIATDVQNSQNRGMRKHSTPYKGVHFKKQTGKYQASIQINGNLKYLGYFIDAKEAARTYDREALAAFGEFALTNQPMGVL